MTLAPTPDIERLAAIDDMIRLKHLYWHYNDCGHLGEPVAALFTENGVWANDELGRYSGRQSIKTFFDGLPADLPFCSHLGMDSIIEIDGDKASATWRALLFGTFRSDNQPIARVILLDYIDKFTRIDGVWYIDHLDILFNFDVPFASSWAELTKSRVLAR